MKYVNFRRKMAPLVLFSLNDARLIDPDFDRRRLHEWQRKGYIKMLVRGWYLFSDVAIDDHCLDLIATRIYAPSYLSMQTVLSRAGLIPETIHSLTAITTRKTRTIQTGIATFIYRTVAPPLFFGYEIKQPQGTRIACLEKAVLDFLYLHPELLSREDYEGLRVDRVILDEQIDYKRFGELLRKFNNKALQRRADLFLKWVRYA